MSKTTSQRLRTYSESGHKIFAANRKGSIREVAFRPQYDTDRKPWVTDQGERFDGTSCFVLACSNPECKLSVCRESNGNH